MQVFILVNEKSYDSLELSLPSIQSQTVKPTIIKIFYSLNNVLYKWKPAAKEFCKTIMLQSKEKYLIINDCNYINIYNDNYEKMQNFLDANLEFGAISLYASPCQLPPPKTDHVCAGAIMIRREALDVIKFDLFPDDSSCKSVMKSLTENGWLYDYLDHIDRCKKDMVYRGY